MSKKENLKHALNGKTIVDVSLSDSHGEVAVLKLKDENGKMSEVMFCTYEGTPWEKEHFVETDLCVIENGSLIR